MHANNRWLGETGNVALTAIAAAIAFLLAAPAILLALVPLLG